MLRTVLFCIIFHAMNAAQQSIFIGGVPTSIISGGATNVISQNVNGQGISYINTSEGAYINGHYVGPGSHQIITLSDGKGGIIYEIHTKNPQTGESTVQTIPFGSQSQAANIEASIQGLQSTAQGLLNARQPVMPVTGFGSFGANLAQSIINNVYTNTANGLLQTSANLQQMQENLKKK